ncbi:vomeromodulin-like [Arvicola amphibius]|uniref:vomeromodulin-like n=1 Tax=Arvicola amphibius TaxID=1047088 RepID=UPI001C096EDB|nr:vomeromodulin-like [Arvicola amphibius]
MWVLWALAIMLSIHAGTLDLVEAPPGLNTLPAIVPNVNTLPLNLPTPPLLRDPPNKQGSAPKIRPALSKGGKCVPAARYFLSSGKLQDYLMDALPPQIEDIVKCDDVNMAGVLGTVIATVDSSDLLSLLDPTSLLKGAGGLGLDGILGKAGNEDPSKPSSGPKAAGGLGQLLPGGGGGLGSLLNLGGDKGPGKGLLNGDVLSDLKKPLDDMIGNVDNLRDSVEAKVNEILPEGIKDPLSDLLKVKVQDLLLDFKVDDVTVDSMDITMAADEIQVHSAVTANIGGKGVLGPVISLLQFQTAMDVTMKAAVSSNNTQCVNLDIHDTQFQVNEVNIQLIETVTGTVPLPVPLPLNEIVPVLLTAEMNENLENSNSCAIVLTNFNECKNATGLFKYQTQSARISPKGLSIFYCAEANIGKRTVPVPGSRLPPDPRNATISVTMSTSMLKTLLVYVAKQSSVKMNDLEANITKIAYTFQKDKLLRVFYEVKITKDGEDFATGKTQLIINHNSKISKSKLVPDIKLTRSDHRVEPPEAKEQVEGILSEVMKKSWSVFNELYKQMNVPEGVSSFALLNADVIPLKSVRN